MEKFFISHLTATVIESQSHLIWFWVQNVELSGLYQHTKFERNQSVNVQMQTIFFLVCFLLSHVKWQKSMVPISTASMKNFIKKFAGNVQH